MCILSLLSLDYVHLSFNYVHLNHTFQKLLDACFIVICIEQ